ncbi:sigma-70 family RNA polymerase sigma factor [Chitinophaga niabensis]|uniref:RNA polymerase sigma factor n=1 Tax=Chitinophaga niabensis TaxID=536979 RepID=UPI0031BABD90
MQQTNEPVSLWQKIRKGDKEALFVLYDDMYFHLVRYGLSVYADSDLVKDCIGHLFLKLWDSHTTLNNVENVRSYLFTSLRRTIVDYLNAAGRTASAMLEIHEEEGTEASYEEIIIARERDEEINRDLRNALNTLSPKQIELIRMRFFENLSYKEIAHLNSQSVKTSYNTIYDAIKMLRLKLKM